MGHSLSGIKAGLAINLDQNILSAALPLLQGSKVETIEWSFDTLFNHRNIPGWFVELLETYSKANALIGHGVFFSLFNATWTEKQTQWLEHLDKVNRHFQFDHITEHFGYMTGLDFHRGAPMPVPLNETTLALGQQRLQMIGNVVQCPIGLENLAFAFCLDDVKRHGEFLEKLVSKCNGFLILDLHNLYCQAANFDINPELLIESYPLDLVKEIHLSGGSWEESNLSPSRSIRRDTHDDGVPEIVFDLLGKTLVQCEHVTHVILEQLGVGLKTDKSRHRFESDFLRMQEVLELTIPSNGKPINPTQFKYQSHEPCQINSFDLERLNVQQSALSSLLEDSESVTELIYLLQNSNLAATDWAVETWDESMIETAYQIVQKWK